MAIVKCKGTKLQHTVSASLVDIAQILSIEHSGSGSETFESTTLDGGVYKTFAPTGYSNPGQVSAEIFYDPALAGHQAVTDLIATPATNAMRIIYADTAATNQAFTAKTSRSAPLLCCLRRSRPRQSRAIRGATGRWSRCSSGDSGLLCRGLIPTCWSAWGSPSRKTRNACNVRP